MTIGRRFQRTANLLRYHQPSQFAWRFFRIAQRRLAKFLPPKSVDSYGTARLAENAVEPLKKMAQRRLALWPSRSDPQKLSRMVHGQFEFLNQRKVLSPDSSTRRHPSIRWQSDAPRLWCFHLQCQEHLLELARDQGAESAWWLVSSWLTEPKHAHPHDDPDAWHPFCISRRLPGWLMLAATETVPEDIEELFWNSVAAQYGWLLANLEWDLGGNHLLENLRTLVLANTFLEVDFPVDQDRLIQWVLKQINLQVLASGEHFERTPTYHALMLLSVLEISEAFEDSGLSEAKLLRELAARMAHFLQSIVHPDGQIPLFGDSVFEETPLPGQLCKAVLGDQPGLDAVSKHHIDGTGYRTFSGEPGHWLILDHSPTACDHLPAHGHADLFTVEASLAGHRVLVDTGTYDYEDSAMREHCRGTVSHNTLQVDGSDHCDVWSRFRMGRRGHPTGFWSHCDEHVDWAACTHDANRHLGIRTTGRFVASGTNQVGQWAGWLIADWIIAKSPHEMKSRLHFCPEIQLSMVDSGRAEFRIASGRSREDLYEVCFLSQGAMTLEEGWYCPDFGVKHKNQVLVGTGQRSRGGAIGWLIRPLRETADPLPTIEGDFSEHGNIRVHWLSDAGICVNFT